MLNEKKKNKKKMITSSISIARTRPVYTFSSSSSYQLPTIASVV
jgi:hypothetical protein